MTDSGIGPRSHRTLAWVAAALALILALVLVVQFVVVPRLEVRTIDIESDGEWPRDYLLSWLGLEGRVLWLDVNEVTLLARLQSLPAVRTARVRRVFPDRLEISIQARTPLVQHILDEGTVVLIDGDGVAYDYVKERIAYDLPVLSGLTFRGFAPGTRLPPFLQPFFHDLEALQQEQPALFQVFSEFRLSPLDQADLEILCYTMNAAVPIRIGPRLGAGDARAMLRVLGLLESGQGYHGIEELDFRAEDVLIKKGGA